MEVTIRRCAPGDAAALALVGKATFLETYIEGLPGTDIIAHCRTEHAEARYAAWLDAPDHDLWIAEARGGAPVGYAVLSPADLPVAPQAGDLELKRIYLLSRAQGTGAGARLMAAAVEGARARGGRRLLLGVWGGNERAMGFYARQGFTQAGVRRFKVGANTYDDLVLARSL